MTLRLLRQARHLVAVEPTVEVLRVTAACSHDAHITHGGRRLGLHVHPSGASASLYPDYDPGVLHTPAARRYKCSCGRAFETPHGLAVHQGKQRRDNWTNPAQSRYVRHLTVEV